MADYNYSDIADDKLPQASREDCEKTSYNRNRSLFNSSGRGFQDRVQMIQHSKETITINTDYLEVSVTLRDPNSTLDKDNLNRKSTLKNPTPNTLISATSYKTNEMDTDDPVDLDSRCQDYSVSAINTVTNKLFVDETADTLCLEEQRRKCLTPIDPFGLLEMLLECKQCKPVVKFSTRLQGFGHLQNFHGLKYCPVCFQLINCHEIYMLDHLKRNHFINLQGDVHCSICLEIFNHVLCFDHINKKHLKPLELELEGIKPIANSTNPDSKKNIRNLNETPGFSGNLLMEPSSSGENKSGLRNIKEELELAEHKHNPGEVRDNNSLLNDFFMNKRYPTPLEKLDLASQTNRTYQQVAVWFQNKRKNLSSKIQNSSLSSAQSELLLAVLDRNRYPNITARVSLAQETGLSSQQVAKWFRVQRCKMKRAELRKKHKSSSQLTPSSRKTAPPGLKTRLKVSTKQIGRANLLSTSQQYLSLARNRLTTVKCYTNKNKGLTLTKKPTSVNQEQDTAGWPISFTPRNVEETTEVSRRPVMPAEITKMHMSNAARLSTQSSRLRVKKCTINVNNYQRKGVSKRYSTKVKNVLEKFWEQKQFPTPEEKKQLSVITCLSELQIKVYFTNQRSKLRTCIKNDNDLDVRKRNFHLNALSKLENTNLRDANLNMSVDSQRLFKSSQLEVMMETFNSNVRQNSDEITRVAKLINADFPRVEQWFANRLHRLRKGKVSGYELKNNMAVEIAKATYETLRNPEFQKKNENTTINPTAILKAESEIKVDGPKANVKNQLLTLPITKRPTIKSQVSMKPKAMPRISQDSTLQPIVRLVRLEDWVIKSTEESPVNKDPEVTTSKSKTITAVRRTNKIYQGSKFGKFSENQNKVLLKSFEKDVKPNLIEKNRLAALAKLTTAQVDSWFRNRRWSMGKNTRRCNSSKVRSQNCSISPTLEKNLDEQSSAKASTLTPQSPTVSSKKNGPEGAIQNTITTTPVKRRTNTIYRGSKLRKSRPFSEHQKIVLLNSFENDVKPDLKEKKRVAGITKLTILQVDSWFRSRRSSSKVGSQNSSISPTLLEKIVDEQSTVKANTLKLPSPTVSNKKNGPKEAIRKIIITTPVKRAKKVTTSSYSTFGRRKSGRPFSEYQRDILLSSFEKNTKPSAEEIKRIAVITKLTQIQVYSWFSYQRFLDRQNKKFQFLSENQSSDTCLPTVNVNLDEQSTTKIPTLKLARSTVSNLAIKKNGTFTRQQRLILLRKFESVKKPTPEEIQTLSNITGLSQIQIHSWFRMARFNFRHQGAVYLNPDIMKADATPRKQPKRANNKSAEDLKMPQLTMEVSDPIDFKIINSTSQLAEDMDVSTPDVVQQENIENVSLTPISRQNDISAVSIITSPEKAIPELEVVAKFREIRSVPMDQFRICASSCSDSINFKNLLETYLACEPLDQELIQNETTRLKELIESYELHYTTKQEEILVDARLEIMNGLLKLKSANVEWDNAVVKFHVEDMFRAWHHIAVFASLRNINSHDVITDLCIGLNVHNDELFVPPSWLIPPLLLHP